MSSLAPTRVHVAPTKRFEDPKDAFRKRLAEATGMLRDATRDGDTAAAERLHGIVERMIEAEYNKGARRMSKSADNYAKVTKAVDRSIELARMLVAFDKDAATGKYPEAYVAAERAKLIGEIRVADKNAQDAFTSYRADAAMEARNLRLKAEAEASPTRRLAEMTETKTLVDSKVDASELLARAREFIAAGYPERAAVYADAAAAKGARAMDLNPVTRAIDERLDESNPTRAEAHAIESDITARLGEFASQRGRILAASGVGMTADGSAGFGEPGQAAVASVEGKVAAAMTAWSKGETFSAPVGDGSNE